MIVRPRRRADHPTPATPTVIESSIIARFPARDVAPLVADYVLFALAGALLFGLGPVVGKRGMSADGSWVGNTLTVIGLRVTLFWIVLFATAGTAAFANVSFRAVALFVVASLAASGVGRMTYFVGIHRVGSSLSSAVANTRPLFAVILGVLWLGEQFTSKMFVGVLLLVAGLVVLSLSRGGDIGGWDRIELLFPLCAAVFWAFGNVVRRFGFTSSEMSTIQALAIGETSSLLLIAGYAVATGRLGDLRVRRRTHALFAGHGLLAGVGLFCVFEALRRGPVSIVDPLVGTTPLFTAIFAAVFLQQFERVTRRVAVGCVTIVAGAALVA